MSLQDTNPSAQFYSHDFLQGSQSLWTQRPLIITPYLPAEIRIKIYNQFLLSSAWNLNQPRITEYKGPILAPAQSRNAYQALGHTFMTTYNEDERHNAKPNHFGLTWWSSEHEKIKTETDLYNEYVFKITSLNIDKLGDWTPPLPIEKYKRIVLRMHPEGFFTMPGVPPQIILLATHQNLGPLQWPSQNPNVETIKDFIAKSTSLYSFHICIEDKGRTPRGAMFQKWFGSRAIIRTKKQVTPFGKAIGEMHSKPPLDQIPCEKRWKYAIISARKTIGDRGMPAIPAHPFVPAWLPDEKAFFSAVKTEVSIRTDPPAGQEEQDAAAAEIILVKYWEKEWLGMAK